MWRAGPILAISLLPLAIYAAVPELKSAFPMGATAGETAEIVVLGDDLDGARALRFDCPSLSGEVRKSDKGSATLSVHVAAAADSGFHVLRLITAGGILGGIAFRVGRERAINGRLREPGQLDRYDIEGKRGQRIGLEVITGNGLFDSYPGPFNTPTLAVYKAEGSWLDPNAHPQLVCDDQSRAFEYPQLSLAQHRLPRLICEFPADGNYRVEVGALDGAGGSHFSYQLLKTSGGATGTWVPRELAHPDPHDFRQWNFTRRLEADRAARLQARGAPAPAAAPAIRVNEQKPLKVQVPALIEGSIGRPGDVDLYRIQVAPKQTLVFELETPDTPPPYFNPRLTILNVAGEEMAENIYRKIDGDGDDWVKSLEPKTIYTFAEGGVYTARVRDLTRRNGGAHFRYRLLIREPVPHVGRVTVRLLGMGFVDRTLDRLNIAAGEVVRLPIIAELEEGLDAELAVSLENLPPGVTAAPAYTKPMKGIYMVDGEVYEGRWEGQTNVHRERYRPQRRLVDLLLTAAEDARLSERPSMVQVTVTASVNGKVVRRLVTQEIPLMIHARTEK